MVPKNPESAATAGLYTVFSKYFPNFQSKFIHFYIQYLYFSGFSFQIFEFDMFSHMY